jgi:hypothetical protein
MGGKSPRQADTDLSPEIRHEQRVIAASQEIYGVRGRRDGPASLTTCTGDQT